MRGVETPIMKGGPRVDNEVGLETRFDTFERYSRDPANKRCPIIIGLGILAKTQGNLRNLWEFVVFFGNGGGG